MLDRLLLFAIPMGTDFNRMFARLSLFVAFLCGGCFEIHAATFTWDPSPDASSGNVAGYKFYYSLQPFTTLPLDVATNPAFTILTLSNQTSVSVSTLQGGQTYFFTVTAYNSIGEQSSQANILLYNPTGPAVGLTSPVNGAAVATTDSVVVTAAASSTTSTISKVEFFDGAAILSTKTAAPYIFTSSFAAGPHVLTAKATDATGSVAVSAPVTITSALANPANLAPTAALTSPPDGASFQAGSAVTITATAADADGTIARVDFFDGAALIGSSTVPPYTVSTTALAPGAHTISAKATDNLGATTTSLPVGISVLANQAPSVSLTAPANNSSFLANDLVTISATASDPDGTVVKVEFFDGATLIGSTSAAPYSMTTSTLPAGAHTITAKATDNLGAVASTPSILVTITIVGNQNPTVVLSSPANNATFLTNQVVTISATASDADGSVAKVEFLDGATLLGTVNAAPYSVATSTLIAGTHSLTAKATDDLGATTTTPITTITVKANQNPTVSIASPTRNSSFFATDTLTIAANASDADGFVAQVEFFDGSTSLGVSTASPFSITATGLAVGTHTLSAKATDDKGGLATSKGIPITIKANAAPTVTLTSPVNNTIFLTNTVITIAATASDTDGTITRVDFFDGASLIGSKTAAPYSLTSTSFAPGPHVVTAKAVDDRNATTVSAAVAITVRSNSPPAVELVGLTEGSLLSQPVVLSAAASDTDGSIVSVEFFAGDTSLGVITAPPYTVSKTISSGTYLFVAKTMDNEGAVSVSAGINATVRPLPPLNLIIR